MPISRFSFSLPLLEQFFLLLGSYGLMLSLLLSRGTYREALWFCTLGILMAAAGTGFRGSRQALAWVFGIGLVMLLQGIFRASQPMLGQEPWLLGSALLAVAAMLRIPVRWPRLGHATAITACLLLFILVHAGFDIWGRQGDPYGLHGGFRNPHYLALYSLLVAIYLLYRLAGLAGWARMGIAVMLAADIGLMIMSGSRPVMLAAMVALPALWPLWRGRLGRWGRLLAGLGLVLLLARWPNLLAWFDKVIGHVGQDQRWQMWQESWILQRYSTPIQWIFGHGFGQYYWDYQAVSSFRGRHDFTSPHNGLLDILYSHGLMGMFLWVSGYFLWFRCLFRGLAISQSPEQRSVGWLLLSLCLGLLTFTFFTFPVFSRHHIYPMGLLLGLSLRYYLDVRATNA